MRAGKITNQNKCKLSVCCNIMCLSILTGELSMLLKFRLMFHLYCLALKLLSYSEWFCVSKNRDIDKNDIDKSFFHTVSEFSDVAIQILVVVALLSLFVSIDKWLSFGFSEFYGGNLV